MLKSIGTENPTSFTWEGFRAGRASAMAAAGDSLGQILEAGEWRSRAYLNYVDENVVDATRLLEQSVMSSDDEENDTVTEHLPVL